MGDTDPGRKEKVRHRARCAGALLALACAVALAQPEPAGHPGLEHHAELPSVEGQVGVVHFANSGAERAQPAFQRGLALLHSFEYSAARREFQQAETLDPSFALAVWGEALSYNHTLWHEQDTSAARAAMAKLGATPEERVARGRTARERDYLASLEKLYGPADKGERDAAYSAALGDLSHRYPNDLDAKALYALSLLGLSPKRDVRTYMRAAAEAEEVYEVDRHHPGALHYLIHAYDDPVHAPLGLRAARLYAQVAPGASHAQHMTSHIFFALGLWDDAIKANQNSVRVAEAQGEHAYHSLLWLEYAYLQKDEREAAAALVRSLTHDVESGPTRENRLRAAFARATWLVETQGATATNAESAASADAFKPVDSNGVTYIGYFAVHDFARGLVTAGKGDVTGARSVLAQLSGRINSARVVPTGENRNWYDALTENDLAQARVLETALGGAIDFAEGQHGAGIARVREAIAGTAGMEFEYGPPWSAKPLDELLGELLLADGQRAEAAVAFERALSTYPNRRLSVKGLAACGPGTADAGRATTRQDLVGTWRLVDIDVEGPAGREVDPFYGSGSRGLLIYDASGWFSVQIEDADRPAVQVPSVRPEVSPSDSTALAKAMALDSYYAYFGTWTFDPATSTMTHHAQGALYPAEDSATYSQHVEVVGNHMSFTRTQTVAGRQTVQTKRWERVPTSQGDR